MDQILTNLKKLGFSDDLRIISRSNDYHIEESQNLNYIVLLSFTPESGTVQHYLKQFYDKLVKNVNTYPTTCDYYFSIPLTPLFKVCQTNVLPLLQVFDECSPVLKSISDSPIRLKPFINDYMIGAALNECVQDGITKYANTLMSKLCDKKIIAEERDIPLYAVFWGINNITNTEPLKSQQNNQSSDSNEKLSTMNTQSSSTEITKDPQKSSEDLKNDKICTHTVSQGKLMFPLITSIDPVLDRNTGIPTKESPYLTLHDTLRPVLYDKFPEFVKIFEASLNTLCYPQGAPVCQADVQREKECQLSDKKNGISNNPESHHSTLRLGKDFTINLFSMTDCLANSKVYRIQVPSNETSPYKSSLYSPYDNANRFDFDFSAIHNNPGNLSSQNDTLAGNDDLVYVPSDNKYLERPDKTNSQNGVQLRDRVQQEREKDLQYNQDSEMVKTISCQTGAIKIVARETLQRIPAMCAWNIIDTVPLQEYYISTIQNVSGDNKESLDTPDGAPFRHGRILNKIDFYRMFQRSHEGSRFASKKLPKWWAQAKPDRMIDFNEEKYRIKHRYIIVRHGERTDQIFGCDWYKSAFHQDDSPYYSYKDLNVPRFLPKRRTGLIEFFRDAPLSEVGMFEAFLTGQYFKKMGFDQTVNWVYCSPSLRCIQTIHYVLKGMGLDEALKIKIEPALFEWFGWYRDYCPTFMSPQRLKNCGFNIDTDYASLLIDVKYDPHESLETYYNRGEKFMRILAKKHDKQDGDVMIGGHGATLDVNTRTLLNKPMLSYADFHALLLKTPYLSCTRIDELRDNSWAWPEPRIPPSLPMTYLGNISYDYRVLMGYNGDELNQSATPLNASTNTLQNLKENEKLFVKNT